MMKMVMMDGLISAPLRSAEGERKGGISSCGSVLPGLVRRADALLVTARSFQFRKLMSTWSIEQGLFSSST
jgi:hypothetical protein